MHREICEDAAIYFAPLSPEELAEKVCQIAASDGLSKQLSDRGRERVRVFSWEKQLRDVGFGERTFLLQLTPPESQEPGSAISRAGLSVLHQRYKDFYFLLMPRQHGRITG